jgi:uncharacterized membrane protein
MPEQSEAKKMERPLMMRYWVVRLWRSFSPAGLLLGTLFFAASLTPTLLPRTYLTQGVLSGVLAGSRIRHWRIRTMAGRLYGSAQVQ